MMKFCDKFYFEKTMLQVQKSYSLRNEKVLKIYFQKCFEDLCSRTNQKEKGRVVTKNNFLSYLNLPLLVGEKVFKALNKTNKTNKTTLHFFDEANFLEALLNVYFGSQKFLLEFSFQILDFKNENKIRLQNALLFFTYLLINSPFRVEVDQIVISLFDGSEELDFLNYKSKIVNENSDFFFLLLYLFYAKQPFTDKVLKFFKESSENGGNNGGSNNNDNKNKNLQINENPNPNDNEINSEEEDLIKSPSEDLIALFNMKKISPPSIETKVFKLSDSNKLIRYKLIFLDNNIFGFRFSKIRNTYILEDVHPLNGYYISSIDDVKLEDTLFSPIAFLVQFGNTTVNLGNILFFRVKKERGSFLEKIRYALDVRELEDCYELGKDVGKGKFGKVKLGVNRSSGEKVAVKILEKKKMHSQDIELVRWEIDVMKFLIQNEHQNIVKVYELLEDQKAIYIIMEYCHNGTLEAFMSKNLNTEVLQEINVKVLVEQVARGLKFLHNFGIIHRDLKPDNILITTVKERVGSKKSFVPCIKISDFGLSIVLGFEEKTCEGYGTLVYAAPEILMNNLYLNKVDVWSFGVLLYYLLFGVLPFDDKDLTMREIAKMICNSPLKFTKEIVRGNVNTPIYNHLLNINVKSVNSTSTSASNSDLFSNEVKELIINCLQKSDNIRFNIDQVLNCKWFAK